MRSRRAGFNIQVCDCLVFVVGAATVSESLAMTTPENLTIITPTRKGKVLD